MGLNGRVEWTVSPSKVLISEKESEERGERGHFEGGGKRTPSLLNLAPTYLQWRDDLGVDDYRKK